MRTIVVTALAVFVLAGLAAAQIPTSGNVFFGYSYYSSDVSAVNRTNMNGWEASVEGKFFPFLGIVADFDTHYGSQNFVLGNPPLACPVLIPHCVTTLNANFSENNYLFGPRVSVSVAKLRPFAEALFGAAHLHVNGGSTDTSFATAIGGGLDYKILRVLAWRLQGDYVRTSLLSSHQNNVRISTGIVVRF
ncbi:MAG: hypothetical protein WA477_05595 [Candidatus Sulfotelmatobacter sp.]